MILTSTHAGVCRPFKSAAPEIPDTPHTATAAARILRCHVERHVALGAVCSIMLYSDLAFGATNEVTMEFSTPSRCCARRHPAVRHRLDHQFDRSTFVLSRVEEGGSQFVSGTSQTIASSSTSDLLSVRALAARRRGITGQWRWASPRTFSVWTRTTLTLTRVDATTTCSSTPTAPL